MQLQQLVVKLVVYILNLIRRYPIDHFIVALIIEHVEILVISNFVICDACLTLTEECAWFW